MCPRELALFVIEPQVDNADHRRTIIRTVATVRESGKFLVGGSQSPGTAFPCRAGNDVEIARSDAPASLHNMPCDSPNRLRLPVPSMRSVDGEKSHGWRVRRATPMAKVEGDRHRLGIKVRRAARARLATQPREKNTTCSPRRPVAALSSS